MQISIGEDLVLTGGNGGNGNLTGGNGGMVYIDASGTIALAVGRDLLLTAGNGGSSAFSQGGNAGTPLLSPPPSVVIHSIVVIWHHARCR